MSIESLLKRLEFNEVFVSLNEGKLSLDIPEIGIDDELLSQVKAHKEQIVACLQKSSNGARVIPKISMTSDIYEYQVSKSQQSILLLEAQAGGQSYYNMPVVYELKGDINYSFIKQSILYLIKENDALRTIYQYKNELFYASLVDHEQTPIDVIDVSSRSTEYIDSLINEGCNYAFDLFKELPIRVSIFQLSDQECILLINIHHIAADGWSAKNIIKDIEFAYKTLNRGGDLSVSKRLDRKYGYSDYVNWFKEYRETESYTLSCNYWHEHLDQCPQIHSFPTDYPRTNQNLIKGDTLTFKLNEDLNERLNNFSTIHSIPIFTIIQAAFAVFLYRYTDKTDILFGSVYANRKPVEFSDTVGLFANTLPIRFQFGSSESLNNVLDKSKQIAKDTAKHQQIPFETIVDIVKPRRSPGYNPLIQIMLVMQEDAATNLNLGELKTNLLPFFQKVSKFDFTVHVHTNKKQLSLSWEYSTGLFAEETIRNMNDVLTNVLFQYTENLHQPVDQFPIMSLKDYPTTLDFGNFDKPKSIIEMFTDSVARFPNKVAISDGELDITYEQLSERVANIQHTLFLESIQIGDKVALFMDRSIHLVETMLAVYSSGAVYVPLDPEYPEQRIMNMLEQAEVKYICHSGHPDIPSVNEKIKKIDIRQLVHGASENAPLVNNIKDLNSAAYIIFTSGSTGKPKGVQISHSSLFYSLKSNAGVMDFSSDDAMPTIGSQAFGVSILEMLLPLSNGGAIQIVSKAEARDLQVLVKKTDDVTVLHAVPSLMNHWLNYVDSQSELHYKNLRLLLVGGEPVPNKLLKRLRDWRDNVEVIELYGMTESTVVCSSFNANDNIDASYCVGRPHPNSQFYITNSKRQLQPLGVPGELCISGLSLADGYINNPEATAKAFYSAEHLNGSRLYRTGDRVRLLRDGFYEFLGRIDNQVSLRGVRIEMGEIESLVVNLSFVRQAIATVITLDSGTDALILFVTVTLGEDQSEALEKIKQEISEQLPDYMRPTLYKVLDDFPVNPNGKIDRKALLKLTDIDTQKDIVRPSSILEEEVFSLWKKILKIDQFSVHDDFYDLGGESLLLMQLSNEFKKIGYKISVKDILENPTVRKIANYIEQNESDVLLAQELYWSANSNDLVYSNIVEGEFPVSPSVKEWYAAAIPNRFNVANYFTITNALFNFRSLVTALKIMEAYHTGLNIHYYLDGINLKNYLNKEPNPNILTAHDFSDLTYEEGVAKMKVIENCIQDSFNVDDSGYLYKFVYFKLNAPEPHRLLVVMHHYLVDGAAYIIFIRDLNDVYKKVNEKVDVYLKRQEYSLAQWQTLFYRDVKGNQNDYCRYWEERLNRLDIMKINPDISDPKENHNLAYLGFPIMSDRASVLYEISRKLKIDVVDILTYCMALSFSKYSGGNGFWSKLMHNARRSIGGEAEASELFGPLVNYSSILFELNSQNSISQELVSFARQRTGAPAEGLDYSTLKYNIDDSRVKAIIERFPKHTVSFNFMIGVDDSYRLEDQLNDAFSLSLEYPDATMNNEYQDVAEDLYVSVHTENNDICVISRYSSSMYSSELVDSILKGMDAAVTSVIGTFNSDENQKNIGEIEGAEN